MSNNIFNKEYRRNFIKNSDNLTLNEYLKNLEKISKKGGKYLEIYNEDLSYLTQISDEMESEIFNKKKGNIFSMVFGQNYEKVDIEEQDSDSPCNTEAFVNKIHKITQKTMVPRIDNELNDIKISLETNQFRNSDWINNINKFVQLIFIKIPQELQIKNILKIIKNDPKYTKQAYHQLMSILNSGKDKEKISIDFLKYYRELRKNKEKMGQQKYQIIKEKLTSDQLKKSGKDAETIIQRSKIVEKIFEFTSKLCK